MLEGDLGFVNESICVTLLEVSADNLARDIVVDVTSMDGTATSKKSFSIVYY